MPGEVAEIALMADSFGGRDSSSRIASPLAPVIERAKAGDHSAFEQIVECYQRRVIATAWRMLGNREDARDAAQEIFLRVYKYLRRFRSDQEFGPWLYRIIINVCHDHARKRGSPDRFVSFEAEQDLGNFEMLAGADSAEAAAIRSQEQSMIAAALDTLSKKERAAIVLRDLEGLSTEEVARILGSSQTTVRSQISSARAKMKRFRDRQTSKTQRG
jgi:RNA polymerase sigma-70 factor (ECF subfamily)